MTMALFKTKTVETMTPRAGQSSAVWKATTASRSPMCKGRTPHRLRHSHSHGGRVPDAVTTVHSGRRRGCSSPGENPGRLSQFRAGAQEQEGTSLRLERLADLPAQGKDLSAPPLYPQAPPQRDCQPLSRPAGPRSLELSCRKYPPRKHRWDSSWSHSAQHGQCQGPAHGQDPTARGPFPASLAGGLLGPAPASPITENSASGLAP